MSEDQTRDLLGLEKTAAAETSYDQTWFQAEPRTILGDNPRVDPVPEEPVQYKTAHDKLNAMLNPPMPHEISVGLAHELLSLVQAKEAAMHAANAEADDAFTLASGHLDDFSRKFHHHYLTPEFKTAGLLSIREYYPVVADAVAQRIGDLDGYFMKQANVAPTDISIRHPWVKEAEAFHNELTRLVELIHSLPGTMA